MSHKILLLLAIIGPILLIAAGGVAHVWGRRRKRLKAAGQEPEIRTEATSAVPGEAILPRERFYIHRLSNDGVVPGSFQSVSPEDQPPGRHEAQASGRLLFMKKPPMCHKPGLECAVSGMIDLPAFLGVSSLDLTSLRRGNFLDQLARPHMQ
jgi:hypothetical protein